MSTIEKAMGKLAKQADSPTVAPSVAEPANPPPPAAETRSPAKQLFIDPKRLESLGMITQMHNRRTRMMSDEYRGVKRQLLKNAFSPNLLPKEKSNLIMVSSSNMGEGKTFTSINLCLSMALEKDKTVLLVDADVLKPSVSRTLGLGDNPGLMEYLLEEVKDLSEIIYHTNIPNLRILPAGMPHHLSHELLSSQRMEQVTQELNSRYSDRIVLFDCPPLLGVNETVVLSNFVGQAVVVVEQNKTKLSQVKDAVSLLGDELAIGYVVNKAVRGKLGSYGYGYGYGYGYEEEQRS